jgi:hypothetical protein
VPVGNEPHNRQSVVMALRVMGRHGLSAAWILALLCFSFRVAAALEFEYLPLEITPPRPQSERRAPHLGFPTHITLFELAAPVPLSVLEGARWYALRSTPLDRAWRESRIQHGPMMTTERFHTVDLLGGITRVGEYYTRIEIGGQKVRVQVDTGSSTLALPVAGCTNCRPSDLRYDQKLSKSPSARVVSCANKLCAPDKCSSYKCSRCSSSDACCAKHNPSACAFSLRYGDGSFTHGALMIDSMTWGDNLTAPVVFAGIMEESSDFERAVVDGILGLGYKSLACNPTCIEPPFQQMVKSGVVKDTFTICMTQRGGKLLLGDLDPSAKLSKGPVTYVPLAFSDGIPRYYTVNTTGTVFINKQPIFLPNFRAAVVDSGTTLIAVTELTFALIFRHMTTHYCHIPNLCDSPSWFKPTSCVRISDDVLQQLPSITIQLGSSGEYDLVLSSEDYMIKAFKSGVEMRCLGIMALKAMSPGTDIILGNTIMLRYLTIHDRANNRIGFAESTETCGSPPDCTSYTQCAECAELAEHCAYDFENKECIPAAQTGSRLLPFPICQGASCSCGLGQQAFLFYGVVTGFLGSSVAIAALALILTVWSAVKGRRLPITALPRDGRPMYELSNSAEDQFVEGGDKSDDVSPTSRPSGGNSTLDTDDNDFGAFATGVDQDDQSRLVSVNNL